MRGCDFGCDSDVISGVKIYLQILRGCELDVMRVDRIYQQILHGCESRCESVKIGGYCNGPNVNVECAIRIRRSTAYSVYQYPIEHAYVKQQRSQSSSGIT